MSSVLPRSRFASLDEDEIVALQRGTRDEDGHDFQEFVFTDLGSQQCSSKATLVEHKATDGVVFMHPYNTRTFGTAAVS